MICSPIIFKESLHSVRLYVANAQMLQQVRMIEDKIAIHLELLDSGKHSLSPISILDSEQDTVAPSLVFCTPAALTDFKSFN